MTAETKTIHIPIELLSLVATLEDATAQVWLEDGDIHIRIWLRGAKQFGVIGGTIAGKYNSFHAMTDDDVRNMLCFIDKDGLEVRYKPSDSYEPRKEGDE
jgi:hypothetical protein